MGLDVYKRRVVRKGESEYFVVMFEDETNKSILALFEEFKEYVEHTECEIEDWEATFEKLGIDYAQYEWLTSTFSTEDGKCCVEFLNSGDNSRISVSMGDVVLKTVKVKRLYYTQTGYQRKQMHEDFYTKFLSGCWYVSEDTENKSEDSPDYVLTQEKLDEVKKYCTENAHMLEWKLEENEFVYFSY